MASEITDFLNRLCANAVLAIYVRYIQREAVRGDP